MADSETERWMKDHMVKQAEHTATILNKLEVGESRMCTMEGKLNEVVECTREFPALKISVEEMEAAEEERRREKIATLQMKLEKQEQAEAAKKAVWNDRIWEICVKVSTPLLILGYVIYNIIIDKT